MSKYSSEEINYLSEKDKWKKKSRKITLNILHDKNEKTYPA